MLVNVHSHYQAVIPNSFNQLQRNTEKYLNLKILKYITTYLHISIVKRKRTSVVMSSGFLIQWRMARKPAARTSELSLNKLGVRLQ